MTALNRSLNQLPLLNHFRSYHPPVGNPIVIAYITPFDFKDSEENSILSLMIEEFGGRVASIWSELRPATRGLVERALELSTGSSSATRNVPYDARADLELSRLLSALDEQAAEREIVAGSTTDNQLRHIANTCAAVLEEKTQSAEVFAQLVKRAEVLRDYARIDALADVLSRFAPSEVCELNRSQNQVVRALANEALAQFPTGMLVTLLSDPVDSDIARAALRKQANEFGSDEARQVVNALEQSDALEDGF